MNQHNVDKSTTVLTLLSSMNSHKTTAESLRRLFENAN